MCDNRSPDGSLLADLTEASRAELRERLATIERAVLAPRRGQVDVIAQVEARRAAHKLAGSLDILGLTRAGDLAGELESLLQEGGDPDGRGLGVMADLRREVERGLADAPRIRHDDSAVKAGTSHGRTARILVAEDDDIMALMIESALRRQGHAVTRARDGAEAVEQAGTHAFDLILLDLQMPVMDGADACRALRQHAHMADVPIVLLTAQSNQQPVRERSLKGVTDYLIKPFGVAELRARVRAWLSASPGRARSSGEAVDSLLTQEG